jgi:serine protease Do
VTIIRPGSVAATAGFQAGDVVLSYNQQPVQTMEELTRLIGQNVAGDKVTMELLRDGEKLTKEVVLGKWD